MGTYSPSHLEQVVAASPWGTDRLAKFAAGPFCLDLAGGRIDATGNGLEVIDPSTELVIASVPVATPDDVTDAVSAAADAQPAWQDLGYYARFQALNEVSARIERHADELALIDAVNSGNPIAAMQTDVHLAVRQLRHLSALGLAVRGETIPASATGLHYTLHEPYGVVARIVPFNHPILFAIAKMAAPLITGNTVLIKSAEQTPLPAMYLAGLIEGLLPDGVVTLLAGDAATGAALVTDPRIKRIAFIGSIPVGQRVQAAAAGGGVKHVTLELGGKNPMVVFPDAQLEAAVDGALAGMNLTVCQGQSCGSNSRILVHESLRGRFTTLLAERMERIRVGIPYDPGSEMGPLIDRKQYDRVLGFIEAGKNRCRLRVGGGRPSGVSGRGFFVAPTLFDDVPADDVLAREEVFGPVVSVLGWNDPEEALAMANSVDQGLTASVWTTDLATAHGFAEGLAAGYVWVNDHGPHHIGTPFGGYKSSGVGEEESFSELMSFLQTKSVHIGGIRRV